MEEAQWNQFNEKADKDVLYHLLELTVNKFNEGVNRIYSIQHTDSIALDFFCRDTEKFCCFLRRVLSLVIDREVSIEKFPIYFQFLKILVHVRVCQSFHNSILKLRKLEILYLLFGVFSYGTTFTSVVSI